MINDTVKAYVKSYILSLFDDVWVVKRFISCYSLSFSASDSLNASSNITSCTNKKLQKTEWSQKGEFIILNGVFQIPGWWLACGEFIFQNFTACTNKIFLKFLLSDEFGRFWLILIFVLFIFLALLALCPFLKMVLVFSVSKKCSSRSMRLISR